MTTTLNDLLNQWPPILCRLLVRPAKSNRQLASENVLQRYWFDRWSASTSWRNSRTDDILEFTRICGVDLLHTQRHLEFLRRNNWSHAKGNPYYERLLKIFIAHKRNAPKPINSRPAKDGPLGHT